MNNDQINPYTGNYRPSKIVFWWKIGGVSFFLSFDFCMSGEMRSGGFSSQSDGEEACIIILATSVCMVWFLYLGLRQAWPPEEYFADLEKCLFSI